jgi:hypothetical protein
MRWASFQLRKVCVSVISSCTVSCLIRKSLLGFVAGRLRFRFRFPTTDQHEASIEDCDGTISSNNPASATHWSSEDDNISNIGSWFDCWSCGDTGGLSISAQWTASCVNGPAIMYKQRDGDAGDKRNYVEMQVREDSVRAHTYVCVYVPTGIELPTVESTSNQLTKWR